VDVGRISAAFVLAFGVFTGGAAWAAEPEAEAFYRGKQIRLIVSTDPAGAYDVTARVLAPHLAAHIPGNPSIVVQNMPGASGLKTANFMYSGAPRDGTVIAGTHSSVPTAPLTSPDAASFDVNRFSWIGSVTSDPFVGYVWRTSPVQSLEEARTKDVIMGGVSVGSAGVDMAIIARDLFGLKFKIVTGYKASNDVKLAMERGEVHGTFANAWSSIKTSEPVWIRDHLIKIIVQHGFKRQRDLPDVPLFIDLAQTEEQRQILTFLLARQEAAKPYFAPPDVPAARMQILRKAFDETMGDPKFIADAERARLSVEGPMTGDELATLVAKLSATPPSLVARVNQMFESFQGGKN
jgi:tripartite-type tricarboxylate transporter receptor subunit TctC